MGFWLFLLVLIVLISAIPIWPYSRAWGYGPAGGLAGVLLIVLVLYWFGLIAFTWPFAHYG